MQSYEPKSTPVTPIVTFHPSAEELYPTVHRIFSEIQPGERYHVVIPKSMSHYNHDVDWDNLDGMQEDLTEHQDFGPNIFLALRYDRNNEIESEFVFDIYRI